METQSHPAQLIELLVNEWQLSGSGYLPHQSHSHRGNDDEAHRLKGICSGIDSTHPSGMTVLEAGSQRSPGQSSARDLHHVPSISPPPPEAVKHVLASEG